MATLNRIKEKIDNILRDNPEHGSLECYGTDDQGMSVAINIGEVHTLEVDEVEGGDLLEEAPGFTFLLFHLGN